MVHLRDRLGVFWEGSARGRAPTRRTRVSIDEPMGFDDPMDTEESERRATPRFGISAQVRLLGSEEWAGVYSTGDLSVSGAFLVSDSPPPRGAMVKLDLEVDPENVFRGLEALVVHVRTEASEPSARGCGVMFVRMGKEQTERLRSAVNEQTGRG
jgi:hypothetical protein